MTLDIVLYNEITFRHLKWFYIGLLEFIFVLHWFLHIRMLLLVIIIILIKDRIPRAKG